MAVRKRKKKHRGENVKHFQYETVLTSATRQNANSLFENIVLFRIILRAVEGELISDIQVQRSALNLLCNIVIKRKFEVSFS